MIQMAKLTIRNEQKQIDIPDGARLLEYAKAQSNMLFGCENAECGTCLCTVVKGAENLNARNHKEDVFLKGIGATSGQRLGCQVWVKKGEVEIEY